MGHGESKGRARDRKSERAERAAATEPKRTDTYYDNAKSGTKALGAQKAVGYSFSGAQGSAPDIDAQGKKARLGGRVYQFADKYGGNIDEYSPIWTPETRQPGADN